MSSGERPIGTAKGKQSGTEALCQTPYSAPCVPPPQTPTCFGVRQPPPLQKQKRRTKTAAWWTFVQGKGREGRRRSATWCRRLQTEKPTMASCHPPPPTHTCLVCANPPPPPSCAPCVHQTYPCGKTPPSQGCVVSVTTWQGWAEGGGGGGGGERGVVPHRNRALLATPKMLNKTDPDITLTQNSAKATMVFLECAQ